MPSVSAKQHRFMEAVAHNPQFAQKVKVQQSVGQDFANADKQTGIINRARQSVQSAQPKLTKGINYGT